MQFPREKNLNTLTAKEAQTQLGDTPLKLSLAEPQWFQNTQEHFGLDDDKYQKLQEYCQNFHNADSIVAICGGMGLGDAIIQLRYILILAESTKKQFYCQVPEPLLPLLTKLRQKIPNIEFVGKLDPKIVFNPNVYIMKLLFGSVSSTYAYKWMDTTNVSSDEMDNNFQNASNEQRIAHHLNFLYDIRMSSKDNELIQIYEHSGSSKIEFRLSFILALLGVYVEKKDIEQNSIFSITQAELESIPQDIDVMIIPDAQEFETKDGSRSEKSLPLTVWDQYFAELSKKRELKIAIVMGVAHPDYCSEVIQLAQKHGIVVEVISGDLLHLSKQMLRAKKIIGMDSGTTHLGLDVVRQAENLGRDINLCSIFFNDYFMYDDYGIVEKSTFLTSNTMDDARIMKLLRFMLY